jgi:hypothetical protein
LKNSVFVRPPGGHFEGMLIARTKARDAFDRALGLDPNDDSGMLEYAALANVHKDRVKAEMLIAKAMAKKPREFWHWVGAGGSYLGVRPQ